MAASQARFASFILQAHFDASVWQTIARLFCLFSRLVDVRCCQFSSRRICRVGSCHLFCFCQWSGKYPLPLHFTLYTLHQNNNKQKILTTLNLIFMKKSIFLFFAAILCATSALAGPSFKGGCVYFHNKGGWNDTYKYICISHDSWTEPRAVTVC